MTHNKTAQITNQIIFAVLAMVIILISILIINSQSKLTNQSLNDCESKGGECVNKDDGCEYGPSFIPGCEGNEVCCIKP
tara:strand:+ start:314 stop:550 length:237 start_codon:yes stop_codon:yes gene_type:complete